MADPLQPSISTAPQLYASQAAVAHLHSVNPGKRKEKIRNAMSTVRVRLSSSMEGGNISLFGLNIL